MGRRGVLPKPDHLRQRRNKVPPPATLPTEQASAENVVPPLHGRGRNIDGSERDWHPNVVAWWQSVWRSPMASEYLDADMKGGLYLLADLHQARWEAESPSELVKLAAEIRLQEVRFGLSPSDRSRLRWAIEQGETAAERTEARRERKAPTKERDPRGVLKAV